MSWATDAAARWVEDKHVGDRARSEALGSGRYIMAQLLAEIEDLRAQLDAPPVTP